jgi:hypothetical protein
MLFWQTLYSGIWIVICLPTDLIPLFGNASRFIFSSVALFTPHSLSDLSRLGGNVLGSGLLPWLWTKYDYAGLMGLAFNSGYIISMIASLRLNHESVVFSALANVAVSWGCQVVFYLIPSLQGPVSLPWYENVNNEAFDRPQVLHLAAVGLWWHWRAGLCSS